MMADSFPSPSSIPGSARGRGDNDGDTVHASNGKKVSTLPTTRAHMHPCAICTHVHPLVDWDSGRVRKEQGREALTRLLALPLICVLPSPLHLLPPSLPENAKIANSPGQSAENGTVSITPSRSQTRAAGSGAQDGTQGSEPIRQSIQNQPSIVIDDAKVTPI